ncbi:hypothetical protein TCDM_12944 [Trypanosoma cruzi Dm28c]|uniref:Target of rapamycin (TOR) kinase 1 n=1 Tax=Trypanosoma cruzi Dm28c TaxID=1416333 RepID=V5A4A6_TRYCR|nr:hypothetical protein TCDM_12944 [Trypanosoma cruzi Dm28c]
MGYKAGPEILQIIITSAIAGVTTVVHRLWAASPLVRVDVWIDNIRIAGSKSDATLWETQVLRNADSCHASMGEEHESGATQCTFLGVQFDHTHRAVSLSESLSGLYAPCRRSILQPSRKWRLWRHAFCTRPPFFGTRLCDYYFFIKAVRRRLSALHQGIVLETSPANLPSAVVGLGERLRHTIENTTLSESSSPRRRHRPPSSRTRRSMEVEPFLFQTPATLKLPVGNGRRNLFSSCRRRHERYA